MSSRPFLTFGAEHWLGLALSLGLGGALVWVVRRSGSRRFDLAARWALAAACLASEVYMVIWWSWAGGRLVDLLPLHLCDISVVLAPVVLLTGHWLAYELLFFWGFGGAVQALLTPNVDWGFPHIRCVCCFLLHALIVTCALYATVVMRRRPMPRSLLRAWLVANAYGLLLIPANLAMGTNYMFLLRKPATPSLLDVMGPWPWYVLVGSLVGLAAMALCYLPVFLLERRRQARPAGRSAGGAARAPSPPRPRPTF
jgi:hypothetical integral membrane protein (TIGR02206 family)